MTKKKTYTFKPPHCQINAGGVIYCDGKLDLFKKRYPEQFNQFLEKEIIMEVKEEKADVKTTE